MNKNIKNGSFRFFISKISSQALLIMNIALLPLCAIFIYICIKFCLAASIDPIAARDDFTPVFENLMVSLIIVFCGGAILDLSLKETEDP